MKTKFLITSNNYDYRSDEERLRLKEMASDLCLLYMSTGDSKSLACRKVTFDLSISTRLVEAIVRDNATINALSKTSKHAKKKLLKLDFDPNELNKTKGFL